MEADGVSGKTIANKHGFLAGALNVAVRDGKLKANPCDGNRLPRWDREEMVFLERDEFQILLAAVPTYWKPLVEFLVASGARWSEATALKPKAVDVAAGTVRISKAWKAGAGGYTLGVPKTKMSVRTINVPKRILEQLDLTGEWVFTNSGRGRGQFAGGVIAADDGPVRTHSFNPNVWVPAVTRARETGLRKKPRIHDLRHTCASWLIQAGRPLPAIQAQLGHESITTTVQVYGHLDRSSGQGNADAIADMLG
jgi:integrase